MCLRKLKLLSPQTARKLFTATVVPTMDYGSVVWLHKRGERELGWFNRVQKMAVRAVTGAFLTVSMGTM